MNGTKGVATEIEGLIVQTGRGIKAMDEFEVNRLGLLVKAPGERGVVSVGCGITTHDVLCRMGQSAAEGVGAMDGGHFYSGFGNRLKSGGDSLLNALDTS